MKPDTSTSSAADRTMICQPADATKLNQGTEVGKQINMKDETGIDNQEINDNNDQLYERFNLTVDKGQEPLRIDKFLINRIEGGTRNKLQQAINTGMVLVNGKETRPNYKVRPLDEIIIYSDTSPEQTEVLPENIPLTIVFEDEEIMVINKPVGRVVH